MTKRQFVTAAIAMALLGGLIGWITAPWMWSATSAGIGYCNIETGVCIGFSK